MSTPRLLDLKDDCSESKSDFENNTIEEKPIKNNDPELNCFNSHSIELDLNGANHAGFAALSNSTFAIVTEQKELFIWDPTKNEVTHAARLPSDKKNLFEKMGLSSKKKKSPLDSGFITEIREISSNQLIIWKVREVSYSSEPTAIFLYDLEKEKWQRLEKWEKRCFDPSTFCRINQDEFAIQDNKNSIRIYNCKNVHKPVAKLKTGLKKYLYTVKGNTFILVSDTEKNPNELHVYQREKSQFTLKSQFKASDLFKSSEYGLTSCEGLTFLNDSEILVLFGCNEHNFLQLAKFQFSNNGILSCTNTKTYNTLTTNSYSGRLKLHVLPTSEVIFYTSIAQIAYVDNILKAVGKGRISMDCIHPEMRPYQDKNWYETNRFDYAGGDRSQITFMPDDTLVIFDGRILPGHYRNLDPCLPRVNFYQFQQHLHAYYQKISEANVLIDDLAEIVIEYQCGIKYQHRLFKPALANSKEVFQLDVSQNFLRDLKV